MNISKCLDVRSISSYNREDERLFAGMTTLAITDIGSTFNGEWKWLGPYIKGLLYFERITEQTVHQIKYYNYGFVTREKQKKYLIPLIKHQMNRNNNSNELKLKGINNDDEKKYVYSLFEHFCDSKNDYINLTCIENEKEKMDESSLKDILFKKTKTNKNIEYKDINDKNIKLIFPHLRQYKNYMNYWVKLNEK